MKKVIVAGCGGISKAWLAAVKQIDACNIVALVDSMPGRAEAKREEQGYNCNVYTSLAHALEKEDADIVFDLTPPEQHYNTVTTALKGGCHVFGEKPMAENLQDAEKMILCSDDTKKEYFVMQNYRYVPEIIALKEFLNGGELGGLGQLSANFQLNPHFGGFRDEMQSPLILDMSIHTFDAARFLSGKNALTVFCHEFNPSWSWYKGDAGAVCIFEMENGLVFDYRGCWCASGLFTPWNSEWRIASAAGSVYWSGSDKLYWEGAGPAEGNTQNAISVKAQAYTGHAGCLADMFNALENGKRPQTDCRDNIHSINMVYKAIESSKTKKLVNMV